MLLPLTTASCTIATDPATPPCASPPRPSCCCWDVPVHPPALFAPTHALRTSAGPKKHSPRRITTQHPPPCLCHCWDGSILQSPPLQPHSPKPLSMAGQQQWQRWWACCRPSLCCRHSGSCAGGASRQLCRCPGHHLQDQTHAHMHTSQGGSGLSEGRELWPELCLCLRHLQDIVIANVHTTQGRSGLFREGDVRPELR